MPPRRGRPARGAPSAPSCRLPEGLVDHLPDVVFRVRLSPRPRLEYVSRAVLALSGYPPEQFCADPGLAIRMIHASDKRKVQDIGRSGRLPAQPMQLRWTRRDGAVVRTEVTLVPLHGRRGNITAIDGIAHDVTGAAEAAATRGGDRLLRDVVEQLPLGVARIAADGRLLLVNHRLCDLTGFTADELLSRRFSDLVHKDDEESVAAVLQQVRASDVPLAVADHRVACKDGSTGWVKLTACRLRNAADGQAVVVLEPIVGPPAEQESMRRLSYSGIDVDTDRLEVTWNGRHVSVTLKEVLLLRYLIRHRGEMLARDRLLKDVWGYEHSGRSRTLDVHVCRLRRKLPPLADLLATIGHFGYTLAAQIAGEPANAS